MPSPSVSNECANAPVLIVGAHRSGTSATARALQMLGLEIGASLNQHFEPSGLVGFHDGLLYQAGSAWYRPDPYLSWAGTEAGAGFAAAAVEKLGPRALRRRLGYRGGLPDFLFRMRRRLGRPWGWKEPRTTLFVPAWLKLFPHARVLHVTRDPVDAGLSLWARELRRREEGRPPLRELEDPSYCVDLTLRYRERGAAAEGVARHYLRIGFEEIQEAPVDRLRVIARFAGLAASADRLALAAGTIRPERGRNRGALDAETLGRLVRQAEEGLRGRCLNC